MSLVRSRLMPTVVAVLVTALLGGVFAAVQGNEDLMLPLLGLVGMLSLVTPFAVPVVWAWALLMGRPHKLVLAGAGLWLVAGLVMMPSDVTWPLATHVISGLVAALGLLSRWKPQLILMLLVLVSSPMVIWTLQNESLDEMFDQYKEQALADRREFLKAEMGTGSNTGTNSDSSTGRNEPALAMEEQFLDDALQVAKQMMPGSMVLYLIVQSALTFSLIWVLVRVLGLAAAFRGILPFGRWRLPFAVIWLLAVAVALIIVQPGLWPEAGVNLALVVVVLLAVQGASVQWRLSKVSFPLLPRVFFMVMASMLFLPLVLLGLADQWLDFRKLNKVEPEGST